MMPTLKHVREASICLFEGKYIDTQHLLKVFAGTVGQAQKRLDRRQLYLAQNLLDSTTPGLFRQWLGLFFFSRYKIAELTVNFFVVVEESDLNLSAPVRFRLAHGRTERERMRQASVKVSEGEQTHAEFLVDGDIVSSVVIPK